MTSSRQVEDTAESGQNDGPLDLHEGIFDPRIRADGSTGCLRWPENVFLRNESTGELVVGRCKATNLCPYCQKLYVLETVEMLTLDATEYAPTAWAVLTAREHLTRRDTYQHLWQLKKAARKVWPAIEWFVQVEFQRRGALHLNLLIKGVPNGDTDALRELLVGVWCRRVDALPVGQYVSEIDDARGVIAYISKMLAHGLKQEQAPPIGWKGHRTSQTRGYLVRPASVMREEARRSRKLKRIIDLDGVAPELAELELEHQAQQTWKYADKSKSGPDPDRLRAESARRPFRLPVPRRRGATVPVAPAERNPATRKGRAELPAPTRQAHVTEVLDVAADRAPPN